jgi:hypothetical protein
VPEAFEAFDEHVPALTAAAAAAPAATARTANTGVGSNMQTNTTKCGMRGGCMRCNILHHASSLLMCVVLPMA